MITALSTALTTSTVCTDHWTGPWVWWPIIPILWFLFIVGFFFTFGFLGRRRWRSMQGHTGLRAGEARLAERYAAGEMDDQEYEQRLATLRRLGTP